MLKYDLGTGEKENWLVAETDFDIAHQGKCQAIFSQGNGYLGQRNAFEENYVGQTRDLLVTGTFNKVDENEVTELPNLPDVTNMEFTINGQRFSMDAGKTEEYLRVMDLSNGGTTRTLLWTSPMGGQFRFTFERFASMDNEHLVAARVYVTPVDTDAEIIVKSGINGQVTNTGSQHFHEGDKRIFNNRVLRMTSRTIQSEVSCCLHTVHLWKLDGEEATCRLLPIIDRRYMAMKTSFAVKKGQALTIEKLTIVTTTRDQAYIGADNAVELCQLDGGRMIEDAAREGYEALFAKSAARWAQLWKETDVRLESEHPYDQLAVRFSIYHLNIMIKKDDNRVGIGAKGMTGEGYKGHSFWDTEIFILPYFILTQPKAARTLLEYRYKGLYGAHKKAKENGYEGAMYPWEAAWIDDGEVTPLWGAVDIVTGKPAKIMSGIIEQHITADIAYAVWEYFTATGDQDYMDRYGYEILIDTACFWASRVTWDEKRRAYVLLDILGPDEYKDHVDNNAYTNYMAAYNMNLALKVMKELREKNDEVYKRLNAALDFDASEKKIIEAVSKLYLPKQNEDGIIPQFDGYFDLHYIDLTPYKNASVVGTIYNDYNQDQICTFQVHKQADTVMLLLLLEDLFPADIKTKNYYYYEARTLHDSSLSKSTHAILAADLHEDDTAYSFFKRACDIDLGPVMSSSDMGVHSASLGGIWQCAVEGFGGVRIVGSDLRIDPRMPEAWSSLKFPLYWKGQKLSISVMKHSMSVINEGKQPVKLLIAGTHRTVQAGSSISVSLAK